MNLSKTHVCSSILLYSLSLVQKPDVFWLFVELGLFGAWRRFGAWQVRYCAAYTPNQPALRRNERVLDLSVYYFHLTMFFIVKTSVPGQSVTLTMFFIVNVTDLERAYAFNDEKHR
ncbi:hypothetical protein [Paenibacillus eucommiae]|uniref:hypothetical protein n=1 Tax=Paenibacillus eucommiae TaxID=1355755 RepID=UPI001AEA2BC5|nr:hypothetical protein [Paenibacillus eucommiae]